jgi:CheY-like chemotaxis protein
VNCPQRGSTLPALRLGSSEAQVISTVLIIDDYPAVRKALRRLLEKLCSVVCIEAANGLDAIAKTEVSRPDLIILDMSMPGMNGFETATVLQKTMPQVPIFMFTAHNSPLVESKAASAGIRAVFSKYTGINALVARASELLNPSHASA